MRQFWDSSNHTWNIYKGPCYQRKITTDEHDSKYIVQLTNNYRSHRNILHIANQLFYENRLVARASGGKTKHISIIH